MITMSKVSREVPMNDLSMIVISAIHEANTVPSPRGRRLQIKKRGSYGLSFCLQGKITYTHCGRQFVSDSNHAIILPKDADYTLYGNETGLFPLINFDCNEPFTDTFLSIPLHNPDSYLSDYNRLSESLLFRRYNARSMSILYDMLDRLSRESFTGNRALDIAVTFMAQNYADPNLNNQLLADKAGISEIYLRRLFKDVFGLPPRQYLLDIRIRRARQLLSEQHLTVTQIAEICGFSSLYHFSRAFREITGTTPTDFRKATQTTAL